MGEVQNFTEEHAEGVASLYFRAVRGQNRPPGKSLPHYFTELHRSNPWASPDLPSLVYLEQGKIVGTLGIMPRTLEFRGRPIVAANATLYMVDPEYRRGTAAVQLLGKALKGPQELLWGDGASGSVGAFYAALGGHSAPAYAFNWIRVLRPFALLRGGLSRIGGVGRWLNPLAGLLTVPSDALLSKIPSGMVGEPVSPFTSKLVSSEQLWACIQELGWRETLKPTYSLEAFAWLMREAAKARHGDLRMLTVANEQGELSGWFVYYALRGGGSFVLQIGVRRKEDFRNTLLALFRDAWQQGSAYVKGASIPQYLTTMTEQGCLFRYPDDRCVFHSKNPEITSAISLGKAALTRLEGIGWLRFSRENWEL